MYKVEDQPPTSRVVSRLGLRRTHRRRMKAALRQVRASRPLVSSSRLPLHLRPTPAAHFSTSRRSLAAAADEPPKQEKAKAEPEPEPDTTVQGRSPFQAFIDVIQQEVRKNREWQDSVKQLGGEVDKVQDSAAMRKAKEAYERARVCLCSLVLLQ